jgi:hypothetical protein
MSTPAREICDLLEARACPGRQAFDLVDTMFTQIIALLRRDSRFAGITCFELELLFAGVRSDTERMLLRELHDHVHLDDAEDAVRICLGAGGES